MLRAEWLFWFFNVIPYGCFVKGDVSFNIITFYQTFEQNNMIFYEEALDMKLLFGAKL